VADFFCSLYFIFAKDTSKNNLAVPADTVFRAASADRPPGKCFLLSRIINPDQNLQ
jgi:hypothetical protein